MIILDIPRKTPTGGKHVDIPVYHRTHLGLAQDSKVHFCLVPGQPFYHGSFPNIILPELVISPFPFDQWDNLWRITITLKDRVGLFSDMCNILRSDSVNILAAESCMTEEQNMYIIELIVSVVKEDYIELIERHILAAFMRDIGFFHNGEPRLRIRRLYNLWHVKNSFDANIIQASSHLPANVPFRAEHERAQVRPITDNHSKPRSLRLSLPTSFREILRKTISDGNDFGFQLRISDTKDRFLRVLYFKSSDSVIHARLIHDDKIGALGCLTSVLKENNYSILTALSMPSEIQDKAILEVVIRDLTQQKATSTQMKTKLEEILRQSYIANEFRISVAYPTRYAVTTGQKLILTDQNIVPEKRDVKPEALSRLFDNVESYYSRLLSEVQDSGPILDPEEKNRFFLVKSLMEQQNKFSVAPKIVSLFVSCQFDSKELEKIKEVVRNKQIILMTGENLTQFESNVDGIIEKMKLCTHFLGVWTRMAGHNVSKEVWPSPWLLWELGVAEAIGLKWSLLISDEISQDTWKKIHSSRQHVIFNFYNFETKLNEVLDSMFPIKRDLNMKKKDHAKN